MLKNVLFVNILNKKITKNRKIIHEVFFQREKYEIKKFIN